MPQVNDPSLERQSEFLQTACKLCPDAVHRKINGHSAYVGGDNVDTHAVLREIRAHTPEGGAIWVFTHADRFTRCVAALPELRAELDNLGVIIVFLFAQGAIRELDTLDTLGPDLAVEATARALDAARGAHAAQGEAVALWAPFHSDAAACAGEDEMEDAQHYAEGWGSHFRGHAAACAARFLKAGRAALAVLFPESKRKEPQSAWPGNRAAQYREVRGATARARGAGRACFGAAQHNDRALWHCPA